MTLPVVFVAAPFSQSSMKTLHEKLLQAELVYLPELLPQQCFIADHAGDPTFTRTAEQDLLWTHSIARADVVLGIPRDSPQGIQELVEVGQHISWVQGTAAGTAERIEKSGVPVEQLARIIWTTTAGVHAQPLAEFAVAAALYVKKEFAMHRENMVSRHWPARWPLGSLSGSNVVIFGAGQIAQATAKLFSALGSKVTLVGRKPQVDTDCFQWVPLNNVGELLPGADVLINALPGGNQTKGLIGTHVFFGLKPTSIFISVGRGTVVDQDALAQALSENRLGFAVLDVTDPEPLPVHNVLWSLPNVLISPHTAALTEDEDDKIVELFLENFSLHQAGKELLNTVVLGGAGAK